jgi:hypothetical protein
VGGPVLATTIDKTLADDVNALLINFVLFARNFLAGKKVHLAGRDLVLINVKQGTAINFVFLNEVAV